MPHNPDYVRQAQIFIYVQWIFFCSFGWAAGVIFFLFAVRDVGSFAAIYGMISLMMGFGQWFVLKKFLNRPKIAWPFLTSFSFALGQIAASAVTAQLQTTFGISVSSSGLGFGLVYGGLIGVLLGLIVSVFQLPLLPSRFASRRSWIVTNVIGWGLGFQFSSVLGLVLPNASFLFTSLITSIAAACVTGLWVMQLLNEEGV